MKICLIVLFLNLIYSQNFNYQSGDWFIFTKSSSINSIAETSEDILFGTDYGIYKQNKFNNEIMFDFYNSQELISKKIFHILYDKNTDYYWVVHEFGISYKASISKYWRDINFSEIEMTSVFQIKKIGYNSEGIWIEHDFGIISLDRFNASLIYSNIISEIYWSNSILDNEMDIDLYNYHFTDEWVNNNNVIYNRNSNIEHYPSVIYENSFGEKWIGTKSGLIFYGKYGWFEASYLGLPQNNITEIYLDKTNTWWFSESRYRNNNYGNNLQSSFLKKTKVFLSSWDEINNIWNYYYSNESVSIRNEDINKIIRYGNKLYLGTLDGLLILDIDSREWLNINKNFNDKAIWDLATFNNSLYIATARGINEFSLLGDVLIPDTSMLFNNFLNKEIYKIEVHNNFLYVMSELGLSRIDLNEKNIEHLTNKNLKYFKIYNNRIFINDGRIWEIVEKDNLFFEKIIYNEGNDFCVSNDFLWVNLNNNAKIINLKNGSEWFYSNKDGISGNIIYTLDCDENWIWFGTNEGVSFYNWSKFH